MTEGIDLLATGTLTWETSALVQRLPLDDRVDLAGVDAILDAALRVVERGGGSAANVAVAAAAAGLRVAFAGRVGDDEAGRRCVNDLLERGIHTRVERAPGRSTKRSVLLVEAGTARVQFRVDVPPRSAPPLPARDIGDDLLLGARWLHLDRVSEAGPELLRRRAGRPSSLDLHDLPHRPAARERLAAMLPGLALLQVREGVLPGLCALLAGGPDHGGCRDGEAAVDAPLSDADLARYLERLSATVPCVVTTRGERGAFATGPGAGPFPVPPVQAERVLDSTGAGDAFAAALIGALLDGLTLLEACGLAVAAGARSCAWLGARPPAPVEEPVSSQTAGA